MDVGKITSLEAMLPLCPTLRHLGLRQSAFMGTEGLDELARSHDNDLGNTFAVSFADRLHLCPALTRLDLVSTEMSDTGIRALAQVVRRCPVITRLNITGNPCTPQTARQMRDAWRATHASSGGLWMD